MLCEHVISEFQRDLSYLMRDFTVTVQMAVTAFVSFFERIQASNPDDICSNRKYNELIMTRYLLIAETDKMDEHNGSHFFDCR